MRPAAETFLALSPSSLAGKFLRHLKQVKFRGWVFFSSIQFLFFLLLSGRRVHMIEILLTLFFILLFAYGRSVHIPLRKHAYSTILRILPPKNENFQMKNSDIFLFFSAQNIDCRYSLKPP